MLMLPTVALLACATQLSDDTNVWDQDSQDAASTEALDDLTATAPGTGTAGDRSPNILMISIDTLRRDFVGRYGGGGATPFLDATLDEALVLDDHRSCSDWTYVSSLCAMSGNYTLDLGFTPEATTTVAPAPTPSEIDLLGDHLEARGYATAAVSTSVFITPNYNTDRYQEGVYDTSLDAGQVVDEGVRFAAELGEGEKPWFLHLHMIDPHASYAPPEDFDTSDELADISWDLTVESGWREVMDDWQHMDDGERELIFDYRDALYGGEVAYVDAMIEQLMESLEEQGSLDNTMVVLWSDHGEQFLDHGGVAHGKKLYDEETAAIAAFWGAGIEPEAITAPTTHRDILPTLWELMGWEFAEGMRSPTVWDLKEEDARPRFTLTLNGDHTMQSVDIGDMRMIYDWAGKLEIYDIADDPTEQVDLVGEGMRRDEAMSLWNMLEPRVLMLQEYYTGATAYEPTQ